MTEQMAFTNGVWFFANDHVKGAQSSISLLKSTQDKPDGLPTTLPVNQICDVCSGTPGTGCQGNQQKTHTGTKQPNPSVLEATTCLKITLLSNKQIVGFFSCLQLVKLFTATVCTSTARRDAGGTWRHVFIIMTRISVVGNVFFFFKLLSRKSTLDQNNLYLSRRLSQNYVIFGSAAAHIFSRFFPLPPKKIPQVDVKTRWIFKRCSCPLR